MRIYSIGIGSAEGARDRGRRLQPGHGSSTRRCCRRLADLTNGVYYAAADAATLAEIYDSVDLQLTVEGEMTEVTALLAGLALFVLSDRRRALHASGLGACRNARSIAMSLLWPWALTALLIVPLLLALYLWMLRRKRRYAVRYSSLLLVRAALPRHARWRRHLPFALFLTALAGLTVAMARPQAEIEVPLSQTDHHAGHGRLAQHVRHRCSPQPSDRRPGGRAAPL